VVPYGGVAQTRFASYALKREGNDMDSRGYICAFTLDDLSDVPADFKIPGGVSTLLGGVFLPQSELDWLRRRAYPARVVLLTREALWVVPHPSARPDAACVLLEELDLVECGRILLLGWIGLHWRDCGLTLRYNRRSGSMVERFLTRLRGCWLAHPTEIDHLLQWDNIALDKKFNHALADETVPAGEQHLARFFQPATRRVKGRFFKTETWTAGDLLVLTNRRILWITDRRESAREPYGTVSRSVPLPRLASVHFRAKGERPFIEIVTLSGSVLGVPVIDGLQKDACAFASRCKAVLTQYEARAESGRTPWKEKTPL
jgi:hypothetical protein